jgi:diguanylate cyclase (GGDEF)-like protein
MLEEKKANLKNVIEIGFGILSDYEELVKDGLMTAKEAQSRAALRLKSLRYSGNEYFWVNDTDVRMVMHPIKPELDGTDLKDVRDPNGKYIFREFVKICRSSGSGYVEYLWPKPGERESAAKISYVKLYEPWGWVLGSGIYVDDIKKDMAKLRYYLLSGTILFTLVTLTLATIIGQGITRPLKKVINGLQDIANGKGDAALTKRIAITSIDEIGLLSAEFNRLMESINSLTTFKKVIEEDDSVEEVYSRLGEVFSNQFGVCACAIYEVVGDLNKLEQVYPADAEQDEHFCDRSILENCESCKAKRTAHVISSLTYPSICRKFHVKAGLEHYCIPLVVGGGVFGIVQFILQNTNDRNSAKEMNETIFKAEQYIKEALPVIETKRLMAALRESALRDPMTGLHNRRYLQEYTENIVAGAIRRGKKVGLIMCDLDYFKQVNDTYGHNAGDIVLKETCKVIQRSVRQSDIVIRFGGEEFLVVLLDIHEGDSMYVAEKIREQVQNTQFRLSECVIRKTISLGVTEFSSETEGFWHCIKFADVALYKAKDLGRNQSVRFSSEMWKEEQF